MYQRQPTMRVQKVIHGVAMGQTLVPGQNQRVICQRLDVPRPPQLGVRVETGSEMRAPAILITPMIRVLIVASNAKLPHIRTVFFKAPAPAKFPDRV